MKVKATQRGYYGQLREPGEAFEIANKADFSEVWMVKVEADKPGKSEPASEKPAN